jgi:cytochrome P450
VNSTTTEHRACELGGDAYFADPYPDYARLRAAEEPVFDATTKSWMISRYRQVDALLRDARTSKNSQRACPTAFDQSVLFRDPPEHTRARNILNQAFSGNVLRGIDDRIAAAADQLIDRMAPGADFISAFALPLPVAIVADLLGVPQADQEALTAWSSEFIEDDSKPKDDVPQRQYAAICAMTDYFERLVARRRNQTREDGLAVLMQAQSSGALSHDELIGNCILLMVAGHETTVNLLGNGLYLLLRNPAQMALLNQQPDLWTSAIEEILRYESPVQFGTFRVTTKPIQIGGQTIETGAAVTALIGSANRDPEEFPDPDRFDVRRQPNRHLAFGTGPHRCMGGALARTEARVGFSRLFARLPTVRLADESAPRPGRQAFWRRWLGTAGEKPGPITPRWRKNLVTRGLMELRVCW